MRHKLENITDYELKYSRALKASYCARNKKIGTIPERYYHLLEEKDKVKSYSFAKEKRQ